MNPYKNITSFPTDGFASGMRIREKQPIWKNSGHKVSLLGNRKPRMTIWEAVISLTPCGAPCRHA